MAIPFPKLHIATSAINRILNAMEGEKSLSVTTPAMQAPPDVTSPMVEGEGLDAALSQPPTPVDVPPQDAPKADEQAAANSALGGSPFDGALIGTIAR